MGLPSIEGPDWLQQEPTSIDPHDRLPESNDAAELNHRGLAATSEMRRPHDHLYLKRNHQITLAAVAIAV